MVKVSIIILTYNRKKLLERSLNSAIGQTYNDLEVIVTDDNSSDGTEEFVNEYIKNHKNYKIRYVKNRGNKGINGNAKSGLNSSNGEYVFFLDDDDYLLPNSIEYLLSLSIKYNCDIVYGRSSPENKLNSYTKEEIKYIDYKYSICYSEGDAFKGIIKRNILLDMQKRLKNKGDPITHFLYYKNGGVALLTSRPIYVIGFENRFSFKIDSNPQTYNRYYSESKMVFDTVGKDLFHFCPSMYYKSLLYLYVLSSFINKNIESLKYNKELLHSPLKYRLLFFMLYFTPKFILRNLFKLYKIIKMIRNRYFVKGI